MAFVTGQACRFSCCVLKAALKAALKARLRVGVLLVPPCKAPAGGQVGRWAGGHVGRQAGGEPAVMVGTGPRA